MKKYFFSPLFILVFFSFFGLSNTFAQTCLTASGPTKDLTEYRQSIISELQSIQEQSRLNRGECGFFDKSEQNVLHVFDIGIAGVEAFPSIVTDFTFNTSNVIRGEKNSAYLRDIKIFDQLEKEIENTSKKLSQSCQLTSEVRDHLGKMVTEVMTMRTIFQKTSFYFPPSTFKGIREHNQELAKNLTKSYHPANNHSCNKTNEDDKGFFESLKNVLNFGDKKERMLETWKRAAALITGEGITAAEYVSTQRALLQAELDRQGLTTNMKNLILRNFDCYKAKTQDGGDLESAMKARAECLSMPITGLDKIYSAWNKMVWDKSKNTDEFAENQRVMYRNLNRSVDIHQMYNILQPMISDAQDINDATKTNLINLHQSLVETNEKLEQRLPHIQNNCMKGQPDIIGGCRD